ncbi:hypothetical protein Aperf_G00000000703 [Anoplocephala perfoliata]
MGKVAFKVSCISPNYALSVVKSVLDYAYTGKLKLDTDTVLQIYKLGFDLGCSRIRSWCTEFIKDWINELDIHQVWDLASISRNNDLMKFCVESNFQDLNVNSLENLTFETMLLIIEKTIEENLPEVEKMNRLSTWIKKSSTVPSIEECRKMLEYCDLKKIPQSEILKVLTGTSGIDFPPNFRQAIADIFYDFEEGSSMSGCPDDSRSAYESSRNRESEKRPETLPKYRNDMECFLCGYNTTFQGGRMLALPSAEEIQCEVPFRYFDAKIPLQGSIYLIGGKDIMAESTALVDRINPERGEATRMSDLQQKRSDHSAATDGECIFVFGGVDSSNESILASCERYDPASNSWTQLPDMPIARRASAAVNIPDIGILVAGGSNKVSMDAEGMNIVECLRIRRGTYSWKKYPSMQHSRVCAKGVYHNESVYVTSFSDLSVDMLKILPQTRGQWTLITANNPPQDYPWSMAVLEDKILLSTREGNIYRLEFSRNSTTSDPYAVQWINYISISNYIQPTVLALK